MTEEKPPEQHRAACVIGWPVAHSRSPLIHNYWIKKLGLAADYRREAVPPEKFAEFIGRLAERGYVGANVTVPHKEAALAASEPDERATAVGAANTLWLENGTLRATNTDVEGFVANLDATVPTWDRGLGTAIVLGAGGAARAVVFALIERGIERIVVANRSFERAAALRDQFGEQVEPIPWGDVNGRLSNSELLVNATSLGMTGQPPLRLAVNQLIPSAVVADIVYAPLETELLIAAKGRGLRTVDGLGMLLHQAVGGFARWFGVRPQVTGELRALVEADLMRH
jgi:shikimate dehydrogenase